MVDPKYLVWTRLMLRFLQFAASLVVVVTLSSACASMSAGGYPHINGSNDLTFAMLMNFLGLVYGLFFLVFVDILALCMRPILYCEQMMDCLMVLLLLIASIVLTVSDAFLHCQSYHDKARCDAITVGVAFSYVATAAFIATLVLSFCANRDYDGYDQALFGEHSPISYEYDPTPIAGVEFSPSYETPVVRV